MREHEYEIRAHYDNDKVIAHVWWDGKKVRCDNDRVADILKRRTVMGFGIKDGLKFLDKLPGLFTNGYMSARKVSK